MKNINHALILALGLAITTHNAKAQIGGLNSDRRVEHLMKAIEAGAETNWGDWFEKRNEIRKKFEKKLDKIQAAPNPGFKSSMDKVFETYHAYFEAVCDNIWPDDGGSIYHRNEAIAHCNAIMMSNFLHMYNQFYDDQKY